MHRSQRHFDRGAGEIDRGQYDTPGAVFGVSGAAGCYRRAMLDDVAIAGEVFDEDFFAYREDADLAWRAQLLGWDALYVPEATAHARPARHAGAAVRAAGGDQPLQRPQPVPAAAEEPDGRTGGALRRGRPGPRPAGRRLRAGARVELDSGPRRRRAPAAAHARQAARHHGAAGSPALAGRVVHMRLSRSSARAAFRPTTAASRPSRRSWRRASSPAATT